MALRPDEDGFATSARNPANYAVNGTPLDAGTTIELSSVSGPMDSQTATITLPQGAGPPDLAVVSVLADAIRAANDQRRVEPDTFTVMRAAQITVIEIAAFAAERIFTVEFDEPVNIAEETDTTNFPTSALNLAHYQIARVDSDGQLGTVGPLPAGTTIAPVGGDPLTSRQVTITLPVGQELHAGDMISVVDRAISAADPSDDRRVQAALFEVLPQITARITALATQTFFTITFSEPVNETPPPAPDSNPSEEESAAFATSALNYNNYRVSGEKLPPASRHRVYVGGRDP